LKLLRHLLTIALAAMTCSVRAAPLDGNQSIAPTAPITAYYPRAALAAKVGGFADLSCSRTEDGGLTDCRISSEWPEGFGFGDAAIAIAGKVSGCPAMTIPPADRSSGSIVFAFSLQPPTIKPGVLLPSWTMVRIVRRPTVGEFALYFPDKAAIRHAGGHVILTCVAAATGGLSSCRVTEEEPSDYGFGVATLWLARDFRIALGGSCGGVNVGDKVEIPVEWNAKSAQSSTKSEEDLLRDEVKKLQR
jgi:hypothetical protein